MELTDLFGKKIAEQQGSLHENAATEISAIEGQIAVENQSIETAYAAIGKQYMQLHYNDCEEAFRPMVSAILNARTNIIFYQRKIQKLKGIIICEKCGATIPKNAIYCAKCGAQAIDPSQFVTCSCCGERMSRDLKFCTACGKPLEATHAAKHICPRCGQPYQNGSAFCTACGMALPRDAAVKEVTITCPSCGSAVSRDTPFCAVCGTSFEKTNPDPTPPVPRTCPSCRATLPDDVLFCTECGRKL